MTRDPFHAQIVAGLEGKLDPDTFERCAADLLWQIYPTLVPIPGGGDAGMDGAIADGEGEPLPLVTTTSADVIGNLDRSLRSYLKNAGQRRRVVLATSQSLTPTRRRNLGKRATELGFTLTQVHDQSWFADHLYHSPRWCRELLGLVGKPPALSAVPRTSRPLFTQSLIGRTADLAWLTATKCDRLLVGQPGIGKTFLLRQLVKEGRALFVVSADTAEITAALRELQPEALIVDDAQLDPELILELRRIREELGAGYAIVASCWPGDEDAAVEALGVTETGVRRLDLLTRDEIVEIVNAVGILGPTELIRDIVNQAEGRPGLAVTLAHVCFAGGVRELASGDAVKRSIMLPLKPSAGEHVEEILAGFAIGGDTGMTYEAVASGLSLSPLAVRRAVVNLAAGGIIKEVDRLRQGPIVKRGATRFLSVRPVALRYALLRDVFFSGAASLAVGAFLALVPDRLEATLTLIGARHRGAPVPDQLLRQALEQAPSAQALSAYAWLGRDEANWVLERYPEAIVAVADPALHVVPEAAIPGLLEAAIGDQRPLGPNPSHPLRLIGDWVVAGYPGTEQAVSRRRALLESVRGWMLSGKNACVGMQALASALSPRYFRTESDPGMGVKGTLHYGCIGLEDLRELQSWWPAVVEILGRAQVEDWRPLVEVIQDWAQPSTVYSEASTEIAEAMQAFAATMLRDAAVLARKHPGILRRIQRVARQVGLEIEVPSDPVFDVLYPPDDARHDARARGAQASAVAALAVALSQLDPGDVARQIVHAEAEARMADLRWPRWTPYLCSEIAAKAVSPTEWALAMAAAGCPGDAVEPFLRAAGLVGGEGWAELAKHCLNRPALMGCAISVVLTLPAPPAGLLEDVLRNLEGRAELIEFLCIGGEVSEGVARRLLEHQDARIATAAALGEWYASPSGSVREGLRSQWRSALLRTVDTDHWLAEVFAADPELAADWIRARLREEPVLSLAYERAVAAAAAALDPESRALILREVPNEPYWADLVMHLVGDDLELYGGLLGIDRLASLHLAPLAGHPEGAWLDKAKLALDRGYDARQLALAAFRASYSVVWGSRAALWDDWFRHFEQLSSHEDRRIRAVGEAGAEYARQERDRELKEERDEAVYGIDH